MIRGDPRCVGCPRRLILQHLPEKAALLDVVSEDPTLADILIADRRCQILPFWIGRLGRGFAGIERDITRPTGNPYTIRTNQLAPPRLPPSPIQPTPLPLFLP